MAGALSIRIDGIEDVVASMRAMDRGLPREMAREMGFEAQEIVGKIKRSIPSDSGRAAASVRTTQRANRSGVSVFVKGGGARVPYFGWLDFGGKLPDKRPNTKKALSWPGLVGPKGQPKGVLYAKGAERTKLKDGRYIYPAIRRHRGELEQAMVDAVDRAKQRAGLT
jgi:hypothetical protein